MTIGIIGYGSFGQFVHELVRHYYPDTEVHVFSRGQTEDALYRPLRDVCRSDVLFLCVPIGAYEEVLTEAVPLLGESTLVVDVATVKEHTVDLLKQHENIRYIALHPMFGPYSYIKKGKSLEGLRLVLTEHTLKDDALIQFRDTVNKLGLVLLEMTPTEHDKMLAETLFLTHYIGQVVTRGGFKRTDIDTLSFGFLMDAVESVQNDKQLFQDVYRYNKYCKEVLERFEQAEAETAATFGLDVADSTDETLAKETIYTDIPNR
jgi:prephenate dehydrogenase